MSWIEKLYRTYEQNLTTSRSSRHPLMPICHTKQQTHIEVVIDSKGKFKDAIVIPEGKGVTMVPCTEASSGRTGMSPVNHPLCDKLQYVAADFSDYGGKVTVGFSKNPKKPYEDYVSSLTHWEASPHGHPKLTAILTYVRSGRMIKDLIDAGVLHAVDGVLLEPCEEEEKPEVYSRPIFKVVVDQRNAVVRWRVEEPEATNTGTWEDEGLVDAWVMYYASQQTKRGLCMVTGKETFLAEQHPNKLRHSGDKAKLISSNDLQGFTYRGKFTDADQACGVGFDVSQKAHIALRWLLDSGRRQAFRNGDQMIVTWAVSGDEGFPDPLANTFAMLGLQEDEITLSELYHGDAGQSVGIQFKKAMLGYKAHLDNLKDMVVLGVDSATPGRLAIIFYRELRGSELLERVEDWHERFSWYQNYSEGMKFVGCPSIRDIAEAAYGRKVDDSLKKATINRLLPCVIDGQVFPRDIVDSVVRRVNNRVGLDRWEWNKCLGIACALYRGTHMNENLKMKLEMERNSRDYLYGRLLAIAERVESVALYASGEKNRETSAERYTQRFAERPYSTWRQIELNLRPYLNRLKVKRGGFHRNMLRLMSEVQAQIGDNFTDDSRLSGEFWLGYHCQWLELNPTKDKQEDETEEQTEEQAAEPETINP